MTEHIVPFPDLQRLSGKRQRAAVERWCAREGIRVFHGRDGVWTTLEALNAALGLVSAPANDPGDTLDPSLVA